MEQLETLRRKLSNAEELQSVVKTMKSLAAVNIRQYNRSVDALADYFRSVELGMQLVMKHQPLEDMADRSYDRRNLGAVIFGSDQGMAGPFNDRIADFAVDRMERLHVPEGNRNILVLGERVIPRLEDLGHPVQASMPLFGSMMNISLLMRQVVIKIEEWRRKYHIDWIVLFHNRPTSGTAYRQAMRHLLPLNQTWLRSLRKKPWPTRMVPTFSMDWEQLFAALIREYFFVVLCRASVESLASENASRLAAMQAAEKNIEERIEELNTRYQHQRQATITGELLDIVSGFQVLSDKESR